jgi:PAS domain S-box-containing protein
LLVAALYWTSGVLTLWIHSDIGLWTLMWVPGAIALAIVLLFGIRWWPGVAIGTFLLLLARGAPLTRCALIALNETVDVWIGALLFSSLLHARVELDRVRDVVAFLAVVIVVSLFGSTANMLVIVTSGAHVPHHREEVWWSWVWSNLCGMLIVTPAIMTSVKRVRRAGRTEWRIIEICILMLAGIAMVVFDFGKPIFDDVPGSPYYLVPLLVWAGVRFGPLGASLASLFACSTAITLYALGIGPFSRLIELQSFVAVTSISTLILSALVIERSRAIERRAANQQAALDAIISIDHRGRVVELNPAAESMFQVDKRDMVGKDFTKVAIPPRLRDTFHMAFDQYRQAASSSENRIRYRTSAWRPSDKKEFPVEVAITPVPFEDKTLYTAFIRDISVEAAAETALQTAHDELEHQVEQRTAELRAANIALGNSETLMRQAEELASIGSFEFGIPSKVLKWSKELYRIYGRDPETFIPTYESFIEAIHPDDRPKVISAVEGAFGQHQPFALLERIIRPDGEERVLQTLARVSPSQAEDTFRLVGCCQDITERDVSDRQRSMLVQLVESSGDAIIGLAPDGTIKSWNNGAVQVFGYTHSEVLGRLVTVLASIDHQARLLEIIEAISAGEHISHYEFLHRRRDGTAFPASVTTSAVIDQNGRFIGLSQVVRDITAQKQVEGRLRASLLEKEVLLREIHHRVKNNLQVIASLLNIQMAGEQNEIVHRRLLESQSRIQSMALVHQLLYQSKDLAQINFDEYLTKLSNRLVDTYNAYASRITVQVHAPPIRLDVDHAIPCGLIVNELVTNALTHAFPEERSGTVRIEVAPVNGHVTLTVRDDGIGIPDDLRLEDAHTFGLRIARTLAHQLGGSITLSREAVGTAAELDFPLAAAKQAA